MGYSEEELRRLGFRCGIEIHQQLDSGTKLFCSCMVSGEDVESQFYRTLRAGKGELGETDLAAIEEQKKADIFRYVEATNSCLVEADEEPPQRMNEEAMETALQIGLFLRCDFPDEIHIMRKTVVDGSNTSGFQRTAFVGGFGRVKTSLGEVEIANVQLEEEASMRGDGKEGVRTYFLSRLGIPLVEIGTGTGIKSPAHAKEVALHLGMLLRSTRRVRRGLGSIRQDVNVSIKEGARVEVKGVQDVRLLDRIMEQEVARQEFLVKLRKEVPKGIVITGRKLKRAELSYHPVLARCGKDGSGVMLRVKGLKGIAGREMYAGYRVGTELAGYARAVGLGGLFHTDEKNERVTRLFSKIGEKEGKDLLIVFAGEDRKVEAAKGLLMRRIVQLSEGVPEETRAANEDGSTRYLRPLPGAHRLYPETDLLPMVLRKKKLEGVRKTLPRTILEEERELAKDIGEDMARQLVDGPWLAVYRGVGSKYDKRLVASLVTHVVQEVERERKVEIPVSDDVVGAFLALEKKGKVGKKSFREVLLYLLDNPDGTVAGALDALELWLATDKEIETEIAKFEKGGVKREHMIGKVMAHFGSRADGERVVRILGKRVRK